MPAPSTPKETSQPEMAQDSIADLTPKISVIGVGGAGGNAVNNMIKLKLEGVEFLVCNTDAQALKHAQAKNRVQLGHEITQGLGAGSRPDVGRAAAEESMEDIVKRLESNHMVFITAGMGGGTGTGAAPVIARAARERGILTVGVVTKPFHFEGSHRMRTAEHGIEELQQYVDTLIIIPNQNLFRIANEHTTFADAFSMADNVLYSGVRGVTDLMVMPGLINLDFADIRAVMSEMGKAMMGTGEAEGEGRAIAAAEAAISNPLLDDVSMRGAKGVLINITGGLDMTLFEVDEAANRIRDEIESEANIIFGSAFDQSMNGRMRVSIVATGIDAREIAQPAPQIQASPLSQQAPRPVAQQMQMPAVAPLRPNPLAHNPLAMERPQAPVVQPMAAAQAPQTQIERPMAPPLSPTPIAAEAQPLFSERLEEEESTFIPNSLAPAAAHHANDPTPEQQELMLIDDTRTQPYERKFVTPQARPSIVPQPQPQPDVQKKGFSFLGRFAPPNRTPNAAAGMPSAELQTPAIDPLTETVVGNANYGAQPMAPASADETFQATTQYTIPAAPQPTGPALAEPAEDQLDIPAFLRRKPTR